jgi:hypothetical protein
MIAIDLLLRAFSLGLTGPIGPAATAAFICTVPKNKPTFRSLSRFAIAIVLAGIFAFSTAVIYKSFDIEDPRQFDWVSTGIFYTFIFGCIESISFFSTCVVTPGRSTKD